MVGDREGCSKRSESTTRITFIGLSFTHQNTRHSLRVIDILIRLELADKQAAITTSFITRVLITGSVRSTSIISATFRLLSISFFSRTSRRANCMSSYLWLFIMEYASSSKHGVFTLDTSKPEVITIVGLFST